VRIEEAKAIVETRANLFSYLNVKADRFMNLVVLCDFDGTITEIDTAEFVLARFAQGDWQALDKRFENGEITLEECLRRQFSLVKASRKQILDELEKTVTFRTNFEKLAKYCRKNLIPLIVVSAGLDFVIEHFMKLAGLQELTETYTAKTKHNANRVEFTFPRLFDKTSANFKQDFVRHYKRQNKKVIYIGNGSGDYAAAKDADYLFAIKGSKLAKLCENHSMRYGSITDFQEVVEAIHMLVTRGITKTESEYRLK
jgi:2,3-diketo-5-methylthio-1-phosphopentane phosphatase